MKKHIRYVPTPDSVAQAMLDLADFRAEDTLYDLGCGDGRMVLEAARRGGRGVGVEVDPLLVERGRASAKAQGLEGRADFQQGSLFEADIRSASVVVLYLTHQVNLLLRPKLMAELEPGTRIVSHSFDMDGWLADRRVTVDTKWLFLWTVGRTTKLDSVSPHEDW